MFKGIIRIIISYSLILFSLLLGLSLWGFNPNDLIFYTSNISPTYYNVLGELGTIITTPFVFFYGQASWIWAIFSLYMGISLITGITPKKLLTRFGLMYYLVFLGSVFLALINNDFSFTRGGIFGSLVGYSLSNILPNIIWVPFIIAGFLLGIFAVWSAPFYFIKQKLKTKLSSTMVHEGAMDMVDTDDIEKNIIREDILEELNMTQEQISELDKFYEPFQQDINYKNQVPSFLQEVKEEEDTDNNSFFLSKKPMNPVEVVNPDILRDVDIDLLSPYMNSDNPLYNKLEENENIITSIDEKAPDTTLVDDLKDIVEALDDLDQSSKVLVPNSQWVRESGVSIKDFVRKPIKRLSFMLDHDATEEDKDFSMLFQNRPSILVANNDTNNLVKAPEQGVLDSLVQGNDFEDRIIGEGDDNLEMLDNVIPQHISNFPPVSYIDNTVTLLPEMSEDTISEPFVIENDNKNTYNMTTISSTEITDSERLLVEGIERTFKKQEEQQQTFKDKIYQKQQELADLYYGKSNPKDFTFSTSKQSFVVDEVSKNSSPLLTTSFALHDFEQEILELKKRAHNDTVSQVLSDDVFLSSLQDTEELISENSDIDEAIEDNFPPIEVDNTNLVDKELIEDLMMPVIDVSSIDQDIINENYNTEEKTPIEDILQNTVVINDSNNDLKKEEIANDQNTIEEQILTEQISDDYESPQFASLIRLDLGEVALTDISPLIESAPQPILSLEESPINEYTKSEDLDSIGKNIENSTNNNGEYSWKDETVTKNIMQEFDQFQTLDSNSTSTENLSSMTISSVEEDSTIINFDDIISQMESDISTYNEELKAKLDDKYLAPKEETIIKNNVVNNVENIHMIESEEPKENFSILDIEEEKEEQESMISVSSLPNNMITEIINMADHRDFVIAIPTNTESIVSTTSADPFSHLIQIDENFEYKPPQRDWGSVPQDIKKDEVITEDIINETIISSLDTNFLDEKDELIEEFNITKEIKTIDDSLIEKDTIEELDDTTDYISKDRYIMTPIYDDVKEEDFADNTIDLETSILEEPLLDEPKPQFNLNNNVINQEEKHFTMPLSPKKDVILNNREYVDIAMNTEDEPQAETPTHSSIISNLDAKESSLMPSVVTDGHLIKPLDYPAEIKKAFVFPDIKDLDPNTDEISKVEEDEEIETTMKMIEDTYESFNINMQVVDYSRGPTITRFELEPPSGLKLRTILNLQDDLALQAGTSNLRIISPVEGRSLIGIEVPNKVRRNFLIREQIESSRFKDSEAALPLILGVDVGGKEIVGDLATTPHLLIAGTTGSGKSVYVNALIMGLLFKLSAEDLKFIMIDPKMVELELYSGIPHLLAPIITKPEEAMVALDWAVQEMDRRYKLLSEIGVRNIKEYQQIAKESQGYEKLPYIVIIVDEFANLMLRAPKETEKNISRLASMSRAVGIHLVLATQRPSVDVVTGVIKANFPSRIALRVSSKIDSRTIIDRNGAETLLGRGDMLFMSPNYMEPVRIQSPYASSEDVARAVMRIKKNGAPEYAIDFSEVLARQEEDSSSDGSRTDGMTDPLFEEVLRFSVDNGEISASGIQRRFRVGYNRASRLIETMKDLKIITPPASAGKGWMINITRDDIVKYIS